MKPCTIAWLAILVVSCQHSPHKTVGRIKLEIAVYNDPLHNVYDMFVQEISTLYFNNNYFFELLPTEEAGLAGNPYYIIYDKKYAPVKQITEIPESRLFRPLTNKKVGARFVDIPVPGYDTRQSMTDTSFNGYHYKRTMIKNPEALTVFYIHQTDTLYPYSLAPQLDRDYHGVLNRIDTYEIKRNRFTSLRMTISDTIPESIFRQLKKYP